MGSELIGFLGALVGALIAVAGVLAGQRMRNEELALDRRAASERENRERRAKFYVDLSVFITHLDIVKSKPSESELTTTLGSLRVLASEPVQELFMDFVRKTGTGDASAAGRAVQAQIHLELDSDSQIASGGDPGG